jgi:enoyl-CoA hydratase/carnithine racemase
MSDIFLSWPDRGVALVTIDRARRRNALNLAAWRDLAATFDELGERRDVRLIILTGAGGHFCAGADISEFAELRADSATGAQYERETAAAYAAIRAAPQPTVAAIEGACVGGGCAIALCCDFRVMHRAARFGIPATKLGTIYTVAECRFLWQVVGVANAKRILYSGALFDVSAALHMGFADVVAKGGAIEAALDFALPIVQNAPLALAGTKMILEALASGDAEQRRGKIDALITQALDSADYREGARAFLEKRPPRFTGS